VSPWTIVAGDTHECW